MKFIEIKNYAFRDVEMVSCNRHEDCAEADKLARSKGRLSADHCHDDCCEDCFGD